MKVINPSYTIETPIDGEHILAHIERAGRTCYKSESKITPESAVNFIRMLIKRGHESVIEHYAITVRFICDRGVSHELVRHRIASFSQESTRYCNYGQDKFNSELTFIEPSFFKENSEKYAIWELSMAKAESDYLLLLQEGASPQEARSVLPNSLKTEIVVTANLREWRTILKQRTSAGAHPQIREIMIPLLKELDELIPAVFSDLLEEV